VQWAGVATRLSFYLNESPEEDQKGKGEKDVQVEIDEISDTPAKEPKKVQEGGEVELPREVGKGDRIQFEEDSEESTASGEVDQDKRHFMEGALDMEDTVEGLFSFDYTSLLEREDIDMAHKAEEAKKAQISEEAIQADQKRRAERLREKKLEAGQAGKVYCFLPLPIHSGNSQLLNAFPLSSNL
jgi:hypothetical protein